MYRRLLVSAILDAWGARGEAGMEEIRRLRDLYYADLAQERQETARACPACRRSLSQEAASAA